MATTRDVSQVLSMGRTSGILTRLSTPATWLAAAVYVITAVLYLLNIKASFDSADLILIRLILSGFTALLFLIAGLATLWQAVRMKSVFLRFFALGLLLICLPLAGDLLAPGSLGTLFEWATRISQLLSGAYLLMAMLVAFAEAGARHVPASGALEQRKIEAALIESEERFRTLCETSLIGVGVTSSDGVLLYANRSYELILGYEHAEIIGIKTIDLYWNPEDRLIWLKALQDGGVVRDVELKLKRQDGTPVWVSISASPISYAGAQAVMGTIQDISERRRSEEVLRHYAAELEASNKELESFAYSLSHDLRGPLRTLDGFSQAVIDDYGDILDATGKDYLMRVRGAAQYIAQITEDMLKLSRVIRSELRLETFDLSSTAYDIIKDLTKKEPGRVIEFIVASDVVIHADRSLLHIALFNLLENSWKFTAKSPAARIEFGIDQQDDTVVYFVKDNGIGFDMRYYDKLFQPFQRLNADRDFPGTGIGLAAALRVIRRHGGKIWAESEQGKGTAVYFTLGGSGKQP